MYSGCGTWLCEGEGQGLPWCACMVMALCHCVLYQEGSRIDCINLLERCVPELFLQLLPIAMSGSCKSQLKCKGHYFQAHSDAQRISASTQKIAILLTSGIPETHIRRLERYGSAVLR